MGWEKGGWVGGSRGQALVGVVVVVVKVSVTWLYAGVAAPAGARPAYNDTHKWHLAASIMLQSLGHLCASQCEGRSNHHSFCTGCSCAVLCCAFVQYSNPLLNSCCVPVRCFAVVCFCASNIHTPACPVFLCGGVLC